MDLRLTVGEPTGERKEEAQQGRGEGESEGRRRRARTSRIQ